MKTNLITKRLHVAILLVIGALVFAFFAVQADNVNTSVTVGNTAPAFDVAPAETVASDGTTPTNAGDTVTISATATDPGAEDYYLIVCSTNAVSPTNGAAPTCVATTRCVSTTTTSGAATSCDISTAEVDPEVNDWYAFVCDGNSSAASCSTGSQGSGATGSPYNVNHAPTYAGVTLATNPIAPGGTVTYNATTPADSDVTPAQDSVEMLICRTAGATAAGCDGGVSDTWCDGSLQDPTVGVSCSFALPAVNPAGNNAAYIYMFDEHGFASTSATQGTNQSFDVDNVAPTVSAITLNGGTDISLTEGVATNVNVSATVSDNNSCTDLDAVSTSVYRSGVTYTGCDTVGEADNNNCYAVISCSVVGAGNTCDSTTDASAEYTCTVSVQYHADPTDAATQFPTENWLTTIAVADGLTGGTANNINQQIGTGVELLSLIGYNTGASINYGSLNVGQSNDPLDRTLTVTNTGNVGLDTELSGTDMSSGSDTIAVSFQEYALAASTAYGSGTDLTTSPVEEELNVAKTTVTGSNEVGTLYWGLLIPTGTPPGTYSGTNTLTAVKGEVANW